MGFLDRLLGRSPEQRHEQQQEAPPPAAPAPPPAGQDRPRDRGAPSADEAAIARYRYMLRTAPPEQVEQAHAEAFAKLTPEQRRQVLAQLSSVVPAGEVHGDDPAALARAATRAEVRQPGTLVQVFNSGPAGGYGPGGGYGGGFGRGGFGGGVGLGGTLLTGIAGAFVGTAIADALIPDDFGNEHVGDDQAHEAGEQAGDEQGYDAGQDGGADAASGHGDGGAYDTGAGYEGGEAGGGYEDAGFDNGYDAGYDGGGSGSGDGGFGDGGFGDGGFDGGDVDL